jgi:hypothetical protein
VTAWKRRQIEVATGATAKTKADQLDRDLRRLLSKPAKRRTPTIIQVEDPFGISLARTENSLLATCLRAPQPELAGQHVHA